MSRIFRCGRGTHAIGQDTRPPTNDGPQSKCPTNGQSDFLMQIAQFIAGAAHNARRNSASKCPYFFPFVTRSLCMHYQLSDLQLEYAVRLFLLN